MNNRLSKLVALLLAALLIFSVSAFTVFAEESEEADTAEQSEAVSGEASEEASAEASTEASEEASAEASEEASAEASTEASEAEPEKASSNVPWKLIITAGVIVVIAAVLFILTRTKTKLGQKIAKFFKDYKSEMKKITWMSWKDLVKATATVLVILAIAAVFVGLLDWGFSSLVNLLSSIG